MTTELLTYSTADLHDGPALYVMYGNDDGRFVAYVGEGGGLRKCVEAHLIRRDSAEAAGASAVGLNPDHIREVAWWEDPCLVDADARQAAVIVADDMLGPALRNRDPLRIRAREIAQGAEFRARIAELLRSPPNGRLFTPSHVQQWRIMEQLSRRIAELHARVDDLENDQQA